MTYAESQGKKPFDWNAFLAVPRTAGEWSAALFFAKDWVTCACGNQCDAIPRDRTLGYPIDHKLRDYGSCFTSAIRERDRQRAIYLLVQIEKRSAEILAEMEEKI